MYFEDCESVKDFQDEIRKHRKESQADLQQVYEDSRDHIRRLRKKYNPLLAKHECEPLPAPPLLRTDSARAGLDDALGWCDDAEQILERVPLSFDLNVLTDFINDLTEFERTLARLSPPGEDVWSKAKEELGARPEYAEAAASLRKRRSDEAEASSTAAGAKSDGMTLTDRIRAKVARERAMVAQEHSLFAFIKAVERHCRGLDPAYAHTIERAATQSARIAERLDQLWQSPASSMVVVYDALMGGKIKHLLEQARLYSIDTFVDASLHGIAEPWFCKLLREAIGIFEGFRDRIEAAAPQDQAGPSEAAEPSPTGGVDETAPPTQTPPETWEANELQIKIVHDLRDRLARWRMAADTHGADSPEARKVGGAALKMLCGSVPVLKCCQRELGAFEETRFIIREAEAYAERLAETEFPDWATEDNCRFFCNAEFIADLERWETAGQRPPVKLYPHGDEIAINGARHTVKGVKNWCFLTQLDGSRRTGLSKKAYKNQYDALAHRLGRETVEQFIETKASKYFLRANAEVLKEG